MAVTEMIPQMLELRPAFGGHFCLRIQVAAFFRKKHITAKCREILPPEKAVV